MAKLDRGRKMQPMTLGAALKAVRGRVKQEVVAATMGETQSTISDWERGQRPPTIDDIRRFEQAVGAALGSVLTLAGYVEQPAASVEAAILSAQLDEHEESFLLQAYRRAAQPPRPAGAR